MCCYIVQIRIGVFQVVTLNGDLSKEKSHKNVLSICCFTYRHSFRDYCTTAVTSSCYY